MSVGRVLSGRRDGDWGGQALQALGQQGLKFLVQVVDQFQRARTSLPQRCDQLSNVSSRSAVGARRTQLLEVALVLDPQLVYLIIILLKTNPLGDICFLCHL